MVQSIIHCSKYRVISRASKYSILRILNILRINLSTSSQNDDSNKNKSTKEIEIPEPPTNCCMSGCPNCVWVEYAEKLTKLFNDGGEKAQKQIMETVTDPNMRAFLMSEIRSLKIKK